MDWPVAARCASRSTSSCCMAVNTTDGAAWDSRVPVEASCPEPSAFISTPSGDVSVPAAMPQASSARSSVITKSMTRCFGCGRQCIHRRSASCASHGDCLSAAGNEVWVARNSCTGCAKKWSTGAELAPVPAPAPVTRLTSSLTVCVGDTPAPRCAWSGGVSSTVSVAGSSCKSFPAATTCDETTEKRSCVRMCCTKQVVDENYQSPAQTTDTHQIPMRVKHGQRHACRTKDAGLQQVLLQKVC